MDTRLLTKLQEVEVEILNEIVRICDLYEIEYYLIGGTLLGAVRHKGFIPWDDDLDIAIPRKDFNKFIKVAKKDMKGEYFLQTSYTDKGYGRMFAKVRKNNTLFVEQDDVHIKKHHGIYVDIFPLDDGTEAFVEKIPFSKRIAFGLSSYINSYRNKLPIAAKKKILKFFPVCFLSRIRDLLYVGRGDCYINYGSQYGIAKQTIKKSYYYPPIKMEFKNNYYNVPKNYKYVLGRIYGDNYMEFPPKEKRVTHNPVKISFDTTKQSESLETNSTKKYKIGYTTGVFDMFHIGHLNILRQAKEQCEYLIVGVSDDELVQKYKNKSPIIRFEERKRIVEAIKYVDLVVEQETMDKLEAWNKLHFDVIFHGDDWKGSNMYNEIEEKLKKVGCEIVYLPHTEGTSSTLLTQVLYKHLENDN